jgi:hypothetical protein
MEWVWLIPRIRCTDAERIEDEEMGMKHNNENKALRPRKDGR